MITLPTLGPPLIIFELLNDFGQISLNIEVTTVKYKKIRCWLEERGPH